MQTFAKNCGQTHPARSKVLFTIAKMVYTASTDAMTNTHNKRKQTGTNFPLMLRFCRCCGR